MKLYVDYVVGEWRSCVNRKAVSKTGICLRYVPGCKYPEYDDVHPRVVLERM